ncbi:hypothetical protein AX14_002060 [Amanita brunnescens Koide BX004]|nr:hypothetical protein AX14_002060 [Amanita brunnescens Koide BX004]
MLRSDIWAKVTMATNVTSQPEGGGLPSAQTSSYSGTSGSQTDSFLQSIDSCNAPDSSHRRLWQANELTHMQVLQGGSANSIGTASEPGQVILEEFFGDRAPLHPSDLINAMLLHMKPEATIALTHDNLWCDHLPHDFNTDPSKTPNFDGLLENIKRSYKPVIDEHGNEISYLLFSEWSHVAQAAYF